MPYSGPEDETLPDYIQKLPEKRRRQWVAVWNGAFASCQKEGGKDCEGAAFRQANGVVMGDEKKHGEELTTIDLKGVEIFAAGTWNGHQYSTDDLDAMVEAFGELQGDLDPPVKLGHDRDQKLLQADGYPAAGWVARLYRSGEKLVADLREVPRKVADLVKAGAYKKVSSEIYWNYKQGKRTFPRVLKAIAFLGADIPAVSSLDDIRALYSQDGALVGYYDAEGREVQVAEYNAIISPVTLEELEQHINAAIEKAGAEGDLKWKTGAPALRTLLQQAKAILRRLSGARKEQASVSRNTDEQYSMPLFKTEAGYRMMVGPEDVPCSMCRMFEGMPDGQMGACRMVEGQIMARGTCDRGEIGPSGGGMMGKDRMMPGMPAEMPEEMADKEATDMPVTEQQFSELQERFSALEGRLTSAETAASEYKAKLTAAESEARSYAEKVTKLESDLTAERDLRTYGEHVQMARRWNHIPGKPEDLATRLVKLARVDKELYEAQIADYDALEEMAKQSGVFSERGSSRTGGNMSASEKVSKQAAALAKEQGIAIDAAMVQVFSADPGLYEQYRTETAVKV